MNAAFTSCYLFTSMLNWSDAIHIMWYYLLLVFGAGMYGFALGFLASTLANNVK